MPVLAPLRSQPRSAIITASMLLLALITYVDCITGWQVSFAVFYILPIVLMAAFVGRPAGLLIAGLSAFASSLAEFLWDIHYQAPLTPVWNNASRFVFFALIAILVSKLKYQLETLEVAVAERTSSLSKEVAVRKETERELRDTNEELMQHQQQLHMLAMELAKIEEKERRDIAAMLHDHLGQNLIYIKMQIDELAKLHTAPELSKKINRVVDVLDQSIDEVRSLTFELSPPVLDEVGLQAALEWQSDQLLEKYDLRVAVSFEDGEFPISSDVRTTLFQAVRELLVNVGKHAATGQAWVTGRKANEALQIEVSDAGAGFDARHVGRFEPGRSGFGLLNIRQRIGYLGGSMSVASHTGQGTRVTISVPLPETPLQDNP